MCVNRVMRSFTRSPHQTGLRARQEENLSKYERTSTRY